MAKVNKGRTAPKAVQQADVAQADVAPVANPFAGLVPSDVAQADVAKVNAAARAAKVIAKLGGVDVASALHNSVGAGIVDVAPSIAAKGLGKGAAYPVAVANATYTLGSKLQAGGMPAKGNHDVACVLAVQAAMQQGPVTGAGLYDVGVPWHSMRAYLQRGWVVLA